MARWPRGTKPIVRYSWLTRPPVTGASSITFASADSHSGNSIMSSAKSGPHQHTPEEEREIREAALDETLADSFPASDPLSSDPNPDDDDALERTHQDETSKGLARK